MRLKLKGQTIEIHGEPWFEMEEQPKIKMGEKWGRGRLGTYPVSERYNGGISVNGVWHVGILVKDPIIPEGKELVSIACGLERNCCPPLATRLVVDAKK
jgi:hypothetical protein